ncbi:tandem-95 repeat protein [Crocosphaera sp.]|uniref:tandem-95 repeat protein n=1 Tax=Crocosphaera sp. TaxID=2729996 RepID=UPI003F2385CA|nr:tandem-95 repeat protein [Crocosphaera sp.]
MIFLVSLGKNSGYLLTKQTATNHATYQQKIGNITEHIPKAIGELLEGKLIFQNLMDTHIHAPFLDLVSHSNATHVAVNNGSWFDPNTWQDGVVPNNNADVVIGEGVEVFYDQESEARIHTVRVDGSLVFSTNTNTQLIVDYIAVSDTGNLEMGTEINPIQAQANIIFAPVDPNSPEIDSNWDPHQLSRGLVAGDGAKVSIFGEEKTSYVTLADNHLAGSTELTFSEPVPTNWQVGDQIVLTGTAWDKNGSHDDHSVTQDEVLTIESINRNTITFSHNDVDGNALRFNHTTPEGFDLDIHVANLTRNVILQSEGGNGVPASQRGHTMFMDHDTKIYNAGFYGLGRTNKDVVLDDPQFDSKGNLIPGTGTNTQGRYSIHFHEILEHHNPDMPHEMDMDTAEVNGNAVWGSPGWGVTVHSSRVDVENNVSFDVLGAHFVTEDGDEQATFRNNIAIKSAGSVTDPDADLLRPDGARGELDDFGSSGMGYWVRTSYSISAFENNIATGMADTGIIVYGHNDLDSGPVVSVSDLPENLQYIAGGNTEIHAYKVPLRNFTGNTVYNSQSGTELRGITRDDSGTDANNVGHDEQNILENLTIWGVDDNGVQISYASHITLKDSLIVGDPDSPILRGSVPMSTPIGFGIYSDKNARTMVYDNLHVEGFEFGVSIPQTSLQGYNTEEPFFSSQLIDGTFANNTYNLSSASGRVNNPSISTDLSPGRENAPITPYFEIQGNPIFDVPTDDQAPIAAFTSISKGGLGIEFDASQSFDPDYILDWSDSTNHPYTAGDNTIASFAWDYESDGVIDDFGRYTTHVYENPGTYSVTLQVTDRQGNTSTTTQSILVDSQGFDNIVDNGTFDSGFQKHYGTTFWYNSFLTTLDGAPSLSILEQGWLVPRGHKWNHDTVNGWAYADDSGAEGLTKIIYDESLTRGLQNVSFDATNIGSNNTLRLQVFGVNGRFSFSNRGTNSPETVNHTIPFESVTLLDTGNIADNNFDWSTFSWNNINFGEGYEFIAIRFITNGVDETEFQAIDNIFIGNESVPPEDTNSPPVANNDAVQINEDQSVTIDVLANDSDADGDFLFISNLTESSNGNVVDNGDGTITYTPNNNFNGNDSFSYSISDLQGGRDTATVNLTINPLNDAPLATNDLVRTVSDTSTVINVLNNDDDVDGDTLTIQQFSDAANGILTNNNDGSFTYTPNQGFIGTDSFTYTVTDGQELATATAQITVSLDGNPNSGENIVQDSAFSAIDGDFTGNYGMTYSSQAGESWIKPGGHKWSKDTVNEWASADDSGALGLTQVIASNHTTQGLKTISFDGTNMGSDNTLRLQVYGVDGEFEMSNWDTKTPVANGNEPINVATLLDTNNLADSQFDWTNFSWDNIDFGQGYEYIALRFVTGGVSDPATEFQAIDNVFIGDSSNSSVPVDQATPDDSQTSATITTSYDPLTQITTITGTEGDDIIEGTNGDDLINGNVGNDLLTGGAGNDVLTGGSGNDLLTGGTGNDVLTGGSGGDIFNFSANEGRDRIEDFESGDTIRLLDIPQSLQLIEENGNTFLDLGNNQGIELPGILADALNLNILANVLELTL